MDPANELNVTGRRFISWGWDQSPRCRNTKCSSMFCSFLVVCEEKNLGLNPGTVCVCVYLNCVSIYICMYMCICVHFYLCILKKCKYESGYYMCLCMCVFIMINTYAFYFEFVCRPNMCVYVSFIFIHMYVYIFSLFIIFLFFIFL